MASPSYAWIAIENSGTPTARVSDKISVRKMRERLLLKKNRGEEIAMRLLDQAGIPYTRERVFYHKNNMFFMDFLIEVGKRRVAMEVDGAIHSRPDVVERDKMKDEAYLATKWVGGVLRIKVRQIAMITHYELAAMLLSTRRGEITKCTLNDSDSPSLRAVRAPRSRKR